MNYPYPMAPDLAIDKAITSVVEDVLDGRGLKRAGVLNRTLTAADFIADSGDVEMWLSNDELAVLLCGPEESQERIVNRLRERLRSVVMDWCAGTGSWYVDDRVDALVEDAAS